MPGTNYTNFKSKMQSRRRGLRCRGPHPAFVSPLPEGEGRQYTLSLRERDRERVYVEEPKTSQRRGRFDLELEFDTLGSLLTPVDRNRFQLDIRRINSLFSIYTRTCPAPLPAPGLIITPEIRTQCELYLPISVLTATFNRLYSAALNYPPNLSSSPFYGALSWVDTFAVLPAQFQFSANPARLLDLLLSDNDLLIRFLFASFLPDHFYGRIGRYPGQQQFIREWLSTRKSVSLQCLDAACGIGEDIYGLALLLSEKRLPIEKIHVEGWTLEPLEVWAAIHRRFPHDRHREEVLKEAASAVFLRGYDRCISFSCQNILAHSPPSRHFDLILCNGLLGGPIIHEKNHLNQAVGNLTQLLAPGGILLATDSFHGGWKQKHPQSTLRAIFETHGLKYVETGDGLGGLKPD